MTKKITHLTFVDLDAQGLPDCILVDKPTGISTHSPDIGKIGMCEVLESELDQKIYVVHRLDKETSGLLLFAKTPEAAKKIAELFEKHLVQKTYLFLTDKKCAQDQFTVESHIEKEKNSFISHQLKEKNSKTVFKKIKSLPLGDLWQAEPVTGKPHQIRLHAQDSGIAILGDNDHGGSPFSRLCLHALKIEIAIDNKKIQLSTAEPLWANDFNNTAELAILEAHAQRKRLYTYPETESIRLLHSEIDSYRIDQYGEVLWVYWYKESDPTLNDISMFESYAKKLNKKLFIRKMLNRGDDPNSNDLWAIHNPPERWVAEENQVKYELRSDTGLSPGLFLDQRENRYWVRTHSQDRSVLNLFSYTSGFSVNAALAGAREVVTVDVSSNFIEWSKENFKANDLNPENYEFWVSDALVFLKGTVRRKRKFDLIICDPPSFGRSKNGVFSISKNYEELLVNCMLCLNKNGLILFSTNYEKWDKYDLQKNVSKLKTQFSMKILEAPLAGLDFEMPNQDPLMKSILIRKN